MNGKTKQQRDFTAGLADEPEDKLPGLRQGAESKQSEEMIASLLQQSQCRKQNAQYVRRIVEDALQMGREFEERDLLDLKIISAAVREMIKANQVFSNYRGERKVTVFGSARIAEDQAAYQVAREFSRKMVEKGFMVITGAGPGIMAAGNEGAGPSQSFGLRIQLPFEAGANCFVEKEKLVNFRYFFTRKLSFMKETDAVALFPGGFGTLDEGFEALTLIQTGKAEMIPVVMVDTPEGGYWDSLSRFFKEHLLRSGLISETDFELFKITRSVDEAVEEIVQFYKVFHSYRYVKGELYIRIHQRITAAALAALNREFADLLREGEFVITAAHPDEENEKDIRELPRIAFRPKANGNYGRLRLMLDQLNRSETIPN